MSMLGRDPLNSPGIVSHFATSYNFADTEQCSTSDGTRLMMKLSLVGKVGK